jgi:hypothetical protein
MGICAVRHLLRSSDRASMWRYIERSRGSRLELEGEREINRLSFGLQGIRGGTSTCPYVSALDLNLGQWSTWAADESQTSTGGHSVTGG